MSEISRVNNTIANNLINQINQLAISTKIKQGLIMDINKELIKANSINESIDNSFIYYTEKYINGFKYQNKIRTTKFYKKIY